MKAAVFRVPALLFLLLAPAATRAGLEIPDEFRLKREEVFEFAQKPTIARNGDKVTIAFEAKGLCDVTVAIERGDGKIIRHLACGVLGPKAPPPLQKDARKQVLVWDGKDDREQYVDDREALVVRVSLGLKPQFEKTLFWDPRKRASNGWGGSGTPVMKAAPEGVYVYDPGVMEHVRLYDHDGNYVRTVYPFPADKLGGVAGLQTHTFPHDGRTLPFKSGFAQSTLLFGTNAPAMPTRPETSLNATALAVQGNRLAVVGSFVSRLGTDGTTAGLPLGGPKVVQVVRLSGINADSAANKYTTTPCSAALSPDGKSLYLAGFMWRYPWHNDILPGVLRVSFEQNHAPELFAGSMKQDESGTDNGKFRGPTGVACDSQGRVYITDHINDRVQVFTPDGKFLKAIPVFRPAMLSVSPRNGEIYVFSWMTPNRCHLKLAEERQKAHQPPIVIEARLVKLGPFDNPQELASYPLPLPKFGGLYQEWWALPAAPYAGEVDFATEPPTVWISQATDNSFRGEWDRIGMRLLREKGGKLEVFRDFGKEAAKTVVRVRPPMLDRQRLYVNPRTGKLYVGEADSGVGKSFGELVEIDPETGRIKMVSLPYAAEDMAFDLDGMAYLRSDNTVVRFDPQTWREIPWDYGEEKNNVAFDGSSPRVLAALVTPGHRSPSFWHMGGMYVNARGHVIVACPNLGEATGLVPGEEGKDLKDKGKAYAPAVYPGRLRWGEVHVWDRHGKLLHEDAFPGIGHMNGIGLDSSDAIYVMANGSRLITGKPYDPAAPDDLSETLIKVKPNAARVLSGLGSIGVPLAGGAPQRAPDFLGFPTGQSWVEGAEWFYGGVGYTGNAGWDAGGCRCWNARFCLDYYARSFAPEPRHFSVAVLDSGGNLITRVGQYGNVDDGQPLDPKGGPPAPRSIGGDEVGLFHAAYVGTFTDHRLFIADAGNARILSVRLGYHQEARVALNDVPDAGKK
jgi:sugar lactone lactonase YvrE